MSSQKTHDADALLALVRSARGERPTSLDSREAEEVLNMALALLVELAVSNDRIDRLERLVAELKGMQVEELRAMAATHEVAIERRAATDALIVRALRILFDPREVVPGRG